MKTLEDFSYASNGNFEIHSIDFQDILEEVKEGEWSGFFSSRLNIIKEEKDSMQMIQSLEICYAILLDSEKRKLALCDEHYGEIVDIFKQLIFRTLPPPSNPIGDIFDPEEDEPVLETLWPLYKLVYDFFIRFLETPNLDLILAKQYINIDFVTNLLKIFDIEDPRERESCKIVLHRIYGKFLNLRAPIRRATKSIFYEFIYDNQRHNIAEILEIIGSITNGFAIPLKEEHLIFLEKTLLPLHKHRALGCYFTQLCFCITQYVQKDFSSSPKIISALLKIWPRTNSSKKVMFIHEVEEILQITPLKYFLPVHESVFFMLAQCIENENYQVVERALYIWNNQKIMRLFRARSEVLIPMLAPCLVKQQLREHWNPNLKLSLYNTMRIVVDMDPKLFDKCTLSSSFSMPLSPILPSLIPENQSLTVNEGEKGYNHKNEKRENEELSLPHMDSMSKVETPLPPLL